MIKSNIELVEKKIKAACIKYNRKREDILLLPVSKYHPIEKIEEVYKLGYKDFGENKVQELCNKIEESSLEINWHMIGSLQTNKVKYIANDVTLIHSLDRIKLAKEIQKQAMKIKRDIHCLIQVNISKEESKHGIYLDDVDGFINEISNQFSNIKIDGLMTIGLNTDDSLVIEDMFKRMNMKFVDIQSKNLHNVNMKWLSMGMSNDFELAIKHGSNLLRIGTMIFGEREYK